MDTEPRSEGEEATRARELFQATIISRNEARTLVGKDPVEGEDTLVDGRKLGDVAEEAGGTQEGGTQEGGTQEEPDDFYSFWDS